MWLLMTAVVARADWPEVWALGYNKNGQLADGTQTNREDPVRVSINAVEVSAGSSHSLFLTADGTLWGSGDSLYGQLGEAAAVTNSTPIIVATNVQTAQARDLWSVYLKNDGSLWAVGNGTADQFGQIMVDRNPVPFRVADGVKSFSASGGHLLFIKHDDSLWGLGGNYNGRLGLGDTLPRAAPAMIMTEVKAVSAGFLHTCIIKNDNTLWATGYNEYGQLGDGTITERHSPVMIATEVASVAAGALSTIFIKTDRSLWACGINHFGQLGDGTSDLRRSPVFIATDVIGLAASADYYSGRSYFIKADGSLWGMGNNDYDLLDQNDASINSFYHRYYIPSRIAENVASVAAGKSHLLFVKKQPQRIEFAAPPGRATNAASFTLEASSSANLPITFSIVSGPAALAADGVTVHLTGEIGIVSVRASQAGTAVYLPATAERAFRVVDRAPTLTHAPRSSPATKAGLATLSARGEGDLIFYQWYSGPSGDSSAPIAGGNGPLLVTPTPFGRHPYWVRISNGRQHVDSPTAWVTRRLSPGRLLGCGDNADGQLAGATPYLDQPALSLIAENVLTAAAGQTYSAYTDIHHQWRGSGRILNALATPITLAQGTQTVLTSPSALFSLRTDGSLWSIGSYANSVGENPVTDPNRLRQLMTEVYDATCFSSGAFVVKSDLSLWASGMSSVGHLGIVAYPWPKPFTLVTDGVAQVRAGTGHTLILRTDGTLQGLGANTSNQLLSGRESIIGRPTTLATEVVSIAADRFHSLFIKADGSLWGMGDNTHGQLGLGVTVRGPYPSLIATDVADVATSNMHSVFIKKDGSLWAMGKNDRGQLGDGTLVDQRIPVRVADNVQGAWAGAKHTLLLTAPPSTPEDFLGWITAAGLEGNAALPAADPDGDGLPNLLEYGLVSAPTAPSGQEHRPQLELTRIDGQRHVVLSHRRRKNAHLTYTYEVSHDLARWSSLELTPVLIDSDVDGNGLSEMVAAVLLMEENQPSYFLRLKISE